MKKQLGLVAGVFLASTSCFAADSFQVETSVYKANEPRIQPRSAPLAKLGRIA